LVAALRGVDTLYNTYWVRFPRGPISFERAVSETAVLLAAAREAGIRRLVHISVVNADSFTATAYFRAKATVERMVAASGISHAIVRPTLTVGPGDILVNNLAWALRRLPVLGIPGDGRYLVQPVHVEDVARVAIEAGAATITLRLDAAGPETFAHRDLVGVIHKAVRSHARIVGLPPVIVAASAHLLGRVVHDVVLTRDEIQELMGGVLVSKDAPTGRISVADWVLSNGDRLGRHYSSELARNYARG
jgi:NADH dehydrogenase